MSTTENTSAIDGKKKEKTEYSNTSNTSYDLTKFCLFYLLTILFIIGIFIFGSLGLYTTKIAQSNILPDNIELAPYTVIDRILENNIDIDINVMRPSLFSEYKEIFSQKANFNSQEYLDSFSNSFLCYLKKNAQDPEGGFLSNGSLFFSSVYDNIVAKNFLAINTIFYYLSYLPESAIMIFYVFFGIILFIMLYLYNLVYSVIYHVSKIPELFRNVSNTNTEETNKKIKMWESYENIGFFNIGFLKFNTKLLLFCFVWWWILIISAFLSPIIFTFYGLLSPLYVTYNVKNIEKKHTIIDFIKNTFVYKKLFFTILATITLYFSSISFFGFSSIIGVTIAVVALYAMDVYKNDIPESGTDGFSQGISEKLKKVNISKNPKKKVVICKPIPIDKIDNNGPLNGKQSGGEDEVGKNGGENHLIENNEADTTKSDTDDTQTNDNVDLSDVTLELSKDNDNDEVTNDVNKNDATDNTPTTETKSNETQLNPKIDVTEETVINSEPNANKTAISVTTPVTEESVLNPSVSHDSNANKITSKNTNEQMDETEIINSETIKPVINSETIKPVINSETIKPVTNSETETAITNEEKYTNTQSAGGKRGRRTKKYNIRLV